MTYIPVHRILEHIPNKFEAIKVAALECRRLNDKLQAMEISETEKITTLAVNRLMAGKVNYYDARERREQERSEAMIAAAEEMLDMTAPSTETLVELGVEPVVEAAVKSAAPAVKTAPSPAEKPSAPAPAKATGSKESAIAEAAVESKKSSSVEDVAPVEEAAPVEDAAPVEAAAVEPASPEATPEAGGSPELEKSAEESTLAPGVEKLEKAEDLPEETKD